MFLEGCTSNIGLAQIMVTYTLMRGQTPALVRSLHAGEEE